jgi:hypothetical protein
MLKCLRQRVRSHLFFEGTVERHGNNSLPIKASIPHHVFWSSTIGEAWNIGALRDDISATIEGGVTGLQTGESYRRLMFSWVGVKGSRVPSRQQSAWAGDIRNVSEVLRAKETAIPQCHKLTDSRMTTKAYILRCDYFE